MPKQFNIKCIPDTTNILADDNHSAATTLTRISVLTAIGLESSEEDLEDNDEAPKNGKDNNKEGTEESAEKNNIKDEIDIESKGS